MSKASFIGDYKTKNGEFIFKFAFYKVRDHYYEVDILDMPSYGNLPTDLHTTHRLSSNHGNDYRICFGDDTIVSSIEIAKKWAAIWAEHTSNYIKFGHRFPNN